METKREKRKISMSELRQYLSPEEIRRLESNGNVDDDVRNFNNYVYEITPISQIPASEVPKWIK